MPAAETLRAYAAIFEKRRRDPKTGTLDPPSEISLAAAAALRALAAQQEKANG